MSSVLRSVISIAVVLALIFAFSFDLCLCDTITVRNAFTNKTETAFVGMYHPAYYKFDLVKYGAENEINFTVPMDGIQSHLAQCSAFYHLNGNQFLEIWLYDSVVDHAACANKCIVELRDDGSYRLDEKSNTWVKIYGVNVITFARTTENHLPNM